MIYCICIIKPLQPGAGQGVFFLLKWGLEHTIYRVSQPFDPWSYFQILMACAFNWSVLDNLQHLIVNEISKIIQISHMVLKLNYNISWQSNFQLLQPHKNWSLTLYAKCITKQNIANNVRKCDEERVFTSETRLAKYVDNRTNLNLELWANGALFTSDVL